MHIFNLVVLVEGPLTQNQESEYEIALRQPEWN